MKKIKLNEKLIITAAHSLEAEINESNIKTLAGLQHENNKLVKTITREVLEIADKLEKADADTLFLFLDMLRSLSK